MENFHPAVVTAILYFADSKKSMQALADEFGISKQAISNRIKKAQSFFLDFGQDLQTDTQKAELEKQIQRLKKINENLRRELIVSKVRIFILEAFRETVLKFFPRMKLARYQPWQKKYILDMAENFQNAKGTIKDFCKAIGKSYETLSDWQKRYEKHGLSGLQDKKPRPRQFSRKIPKWIKDQLVCLFIRHPRWTTYQYYKYIRDNPSINYCLSIPTIKKMKDIHTEKSEAEKSRIKKRWAFAENFDVWTVDFTTLLKTDGYKLQLLTVSDQRSRFFLDVALFIDTSTKRVIEHLEELFIKYGKPLLIKADNGGEFRMMFRCELEKLCVHLLNSPEYYPTFSGAHERIHRELKTFIDKFDVHRNFIKLVDQLNCFQDDHNHRWTYDNLKGKTPAEIFYSDPDFVPDDVEVVKPYVKEGELRMKFTNRFGGPARLAVPFLDNQESIT